MSRYNKGVIDIYESRAHFIKVYLKFLAEFCILSVISYEFAIFPLRFTCICAILWSVTERGLSLMIKREMYMSRIRPFIGTELIKVMTGIRRCGKSVMLELIKQELTESGVSPTQFISINFEDMSYSHLQTAQALHDEITKRTKEIGGKVYLFFDEIQEVKDWEKCINSFRVSLDCDIYITGSNAKLLSGELATYQIGRAHV